MGKERDSNFETLRLIAMFMIIIHHLVIRSDDTCGYITPWTSYKSGYIGLFINSLTIVGVNIFLLISGWYGIKTIRKQICRLICDCFCYSLIANLICVVFLGIPFESHSFFHSALFYNNWFVESFIMFLLLVPVINAAISVLDNKAFVIVLLCLTIFNIGFGYLGGQLNVNGYNALNFAYLYMIARWLRTQSMSYWYQNYARYGWALWLLCAIPIVLCFVLVASNTTWSSSMSQKMFGYNNPFVLLSSISFFSWFSILRFQNYKINYLAKGAFGVFLLHTTSIFIPFRVVFFGEVIHTYGYWALFVSALGLFLLCLALANIIEGVKRYIISICPGLNKY